MGDVLSISIPGDWFVNPKVLGEFYRKYKDHSVEEIRKVSYDQGLAFGRSMKERLGIKDDNAKAIAALLKDVLASGLLKAREHA